MKTTLEAIALIIEDYNDTEINEGSKLNKQLKELTTHLYYLETIRTQAHEQYELVVHNRVAEGFSVARATNQANVEVPQMYKLRRLLESGYRVADAMRTNISYLKSELSNIAKNY